MAITASQAQGLVLALFGASAGGHLTGLKTSADAATLAGDLAAAAGLILGQDLSSDEAFRDLIIDSNLKLSGDAQTEAKAWMDGEFAKGTSRADILTAAITFLQGLTDETNAFYATAVAYRTTVADAVTWSEGAGATEFGVAALREQQGHTEVVVGQSFTLTTATAGDQVVGTAGDDTINGTASTYGAADVILDSSTTDNDTLALAVTTDISATPTVANIENVNVTFTGFTAGGNTTLAFAADNIGGNTDFTFAASGTTAVTTLNPTALATGSSVTADSTFSTITVTGDDNAALTINGAAKTATSTVTVGVSASSGALTDVTVDVTTGHLSLTASDADGAVSASAAQDVTISAAAATAATITAGDDVTITTLAAAETVEITAGGSVAGGAGDLAAATSLSITAGDEVDVEFDAAVTATISAKGQNLSATGGTNKTSTLTSAGTVTTTLNLSGNGGAVDFDITGIDTAKTLNVSGDQAVKVLMDIADIDGLSSTTGLTLANTNTAATTLSISGTLGAAAKLSNVATSTAVVFTADMTDGGTSTNIITLANGANVTFDAAQGTSSAARFSAASSTASTNAATFTVDKSTSSSSTYAIGSMTTTNLKTVTINLDKDTASTTLGTVDVGSSNNLTLNLGANALTSVTDVTASTLTITGTGDLTLADLSISSLNASAAEGDITYTVAAGDVVQTGSGDDTISGLNNMDASLALAAGNDSVTLTGDLSDNTVVVDMGDGTVDNITIASGASTNGSGVTLLGVEKVTFAGATGTVRDTQLSGQTYSVYGTAATTHGITVGVTQATNDFSDLVIDTATFATGDDYFTIAASSSTAAVTITGSDADDKITGATAGTGVYADVLNGGAGADTLYLTQGGDTLTGGTGTDTVDLSVIDGTSLAGFSNIEGGTSDASGMLVNLSSSAVATTTLLTNFAGNYMSKSLTSIASGEVAYLFATDATTNSAVKATVATIENVNGSEGADYIVGSTSANVINGDEGADYIDGGAGADTINAGAGADKIVGGAGVDIITTTSDSAVDTFVTGSIAADADEITGFVTGSDVIDLSAALTAATLTIGAQVDAAGAADAAAAIALVDTAADTDAEVYYILNTAGSTGELTLAQIETAIAAGSAATGQVTVIIENADGTYIYTDAAAQTDAGSGAGLILQASLIGVASVATGDLISA